MKKITADKLEFIYFTKADGLPSQQLFDQPIWDIPQPKLWQDVLSKSLDDMRCILVNRFPSLPDTRLFLYFLHWDVPVDLEHLDFKVENDAYSDEDFDKSILARFDGVVCDTKDWMGYALYWQPDIGYTVDVYYQKAYECFRRDGFIKICPVCGTKFRIGVLKIFN